MKIKEVSQALESRYDVLRPEMRQGKLSAELKGVCKQIEAVNALSKALESVALSELDDLMDLVPELKSEPKPTPAPAPEPAPTPVKILKKKPRKTK